MKESSPKSKQPTVRVNLADKKRLDQIQAQTELSQPALLHRAIDLLARQIRSERLEDDFASIALDDKAAKHYELLSEQLDGAAGDGFN